MRCFLTGLMILLLLLTFGGCASKPSVVDQGKSWYSGIGGGSSDPQLSTWALAPMTGAAGLLILTGGVILFISRGTRGWWGLGIGVLLCLLSFISLKYPLVLLLVLIGLPAAWAVHHFRLLPREYRKRNGHSPPPTIPTE